MYTRFTFKIRIHSQNTKPVQTKAKDFVSAIYVVRRLFFSSFSMFIVGSSVFFPILSLPLASYFSVSFSLSMMFFYSSRLSRLAAVWSYNVFFCAQHEPHSNIFWYCMLPFWCRQTESVQHFFCAPATDKEIVISFSMQIFNVNFCARIWRNKNQKFQLYPMCTVLHGFQHTIHCVLVTW